jgi:hypothetical protein
MSQRIGRLLLGAGALVRLSYGTGALLAPDAMAARRLAPDVRGHPDGRMDFRGFGALHVNVALLTLYAAFRGWEPRTVAKLNLGCELVDTGTGLLEWRDRGQADRMVVGSLVLSLVGVANWATALRAL